MTEIVLNTNITYELRDCVNFCVQPNLAYYGVSMFAF